MHSEKLSELSQRFTMSLLLTTAEQICQSVTGPPHAGTLLQGSASVKIEPCLGLLLWNLAHNVVGYVTQHFLERSYIKTCLDSISNANSRLGKSNFRKHLMSFPTGKVCANG